MAQEKEVFKEYGLQTEVVDVANGGTLVSSVVSGSANTGMNISPPLVGASQGLRFFYRMSGKFHADLLVKPDSDVPAIEEAEFLKAVIESMKSQKVGVMTGRGVADLITQQLIRERKAEMFVDVHEDSSGVEVPWSAGFIAEESCIEENPDTAQAVPAANGEGIELMKDSANEDAVKSLLENNRNLSGDETLEMAREEVSGGVTTEIPEDKVNQTYATLNEFGAMPSDRAVTYDDVILLPDEVK